VSVECVLNWKAIVGESPVWHIGEQCLYWIDIQNHKIHRFDPGTKENLTYSLPDLVTCIALRKSGGFILTTKKNIAFFNPEKGELEILTEVERDQPGNRFNDGTCDPRGRFWAGTMDAKEWKSPAGHLYRYENGEVEKIVDNVICSNGTGWSPDGRTMYYTESFRYAIFAYDFDPNTGALSGRRPFVELDVIDIKYGGFPDGLTVDAEGFVWSCIVGLGQIRRYDRLGKLERFYEMPIPRATACAFGGPTLQTLYVTSARETMTPQQLEKFPLSGSLFAIDFQKSLAADSKIQGLPAHEFIG
jgi:sugar lactone lactonase YvrE